MLSSERIVVAPRFETFQPTSYSCDLFRVSGEAAFRYEKEKLPQPGDFLKDVPEAIRRRAAAVHRLRMLRVRQGPPPSRRVSRAHLRCSADLLRGVE